MTPQCNANYHYTKQPLLCQNAPTTVAKFNSKPEKCKSKKDKERKIKCVVVGDRGVGKTSLAVSYSNDTFPSNYTPTLYDNYSVEVEVNGEPIRVEICDTAGEDANIPLRRLCYPGTDVFILCFSLVDPDTFYSACTRWTEELTRLGEAVVLVGTQADRKTDYEVLQKLQAKRQRPVMTSEAKGLAEKLNAPYVETSAKTCTHLKEAFDEAITIALKKQRKRNRFWKKLCCV